MAEVQVLEGKWEEIKTHDAELSGKEVRLMILPSRPAVKHNEDVKEGVSLADMLKGRTGLVSFEPSDLSEHTGQKFTQLLVEKYEQKQQ